MTVNGTAEVDTHLDVDGTDAGMGRAPSYRQATEPAKNGGDDAGKKAKGVDLAAEATAVHAAAESKADERLATFSELFRYASPKERRMLYLGVACSLLQGAGMPAWCVLFGEMLNEITSTGEDLLSSMRMLLWIGVVSGVILGSLAATAVFCFDMVGAAVALRTREAYVRAVLSNDATWHGDKKNSPAKLKARLEKSVPSLQAATSSQLNFALMGSGMFVFGLGCAFYYSWQLTLVFIAASPSEMIGIGMLADMMAKNDKFNNQVYEGGARIADEVLTLVRTVKLFNAVEKELAAYVDMVRQTARRGREHGLKFGIAMALTDPMEFALYALGFWYGAKLVRDGDVEVGDILIALYCTLTGIMGLASVGGYVEQAAKAKSATGSLLSVIDHPTLVDGLDEGGVRPEGVATGVTFKNVSFRYPVYSDGANDGDVDGSGSGGDGGGEPRNALNNLSFSVRKGETVAIVGQSGSGKSTVANLLLRWYDPQEGEIKIDGHPLQSLNVQWLRSTIGLVHQQPILLPGTIHDNIAAGKHDATRAEVEAGAALANADQFIQALDDGYDTDVGSLGNALSGGQQQRIAIARTLIGQPPILVLDEASSALDSRSEAKLQKLLDTTKSERATVIIAHRLSTVRDADKIIVLDQGHVVEAGSPVELMADPTSAYNKMISQQGATRSASEVAEEDIEDAAAASKRRSSQLRAASSEAAVLDAGLALDMDTTPEEDKAAKKKAKAAANKAAVSWAWGLARQSLGWVVASIGSAFLAGFGWPVMTVLLARIIKVCGGFFELVDFSCDTSSATGQVYDSIEFCEYDCSGSRSCWGCAAVNGTSFVAVPTCTEKPCGAFSCATRQVQPGDEDKVNDLVILVIIVAAASFVLLLLRGMATYAAGVETTLKTRVLMMKTFLTRSAAWHDQNKVSVLTEGLSTGAISPAQVTSQPYSVFAALIAILGGGLIVAFIGCPELAGIMLVLMPLLGVAAFMQMSLVIGGEESGSLPELEPSAAVAASIVMNSMLLASLGRSADYLTRYLELLKPLCSIYFRGALKECAAHFCMQLIMFSSFGIAFYVGAVFVDNKTCSVDGMIQSVFGIIFCAYVAGMQSTHLPNTSSAAETVRKTWELITSPDIGRGPAGGAAGPKRTDFSITDGRIELKGVRFAYPSRPDSDVLQGLDLVVEPGETVALVGGSGGGKSTLLLLLQKLYRPQEGSILFDGVDISSVDTGVLRRQLGVVSQDVRLFDRSVLDNIAYRPPADGRVVTPSERVHAAAKAAEAAYAEDFIAVKAADVDAKGDGAANGAPGMDFNVGLRGEKLSGGQRQRVAIARALYTDDPAGPQANVVLLDEATSALDSESEGHVQRALAELQKGRTTIVVAHRLSTIRSADRICVLSEGRVIEQGTFDELVRNRDSMFYRLYSEHLAEEEEENERREREAQAPVEEGAGGTDGAANGDDDLSAEASV